MRALLALGRFRASLGRGRHAMVLAEQVVNHRLEDRDPHDGDDKAEWQRPDDHCYADRIDAPEDQHAADDEGQRHAPKQDVMVAFAFAFPPD